MLATPAFSTAATISSASLTFIASGFSQTTILPALAAAMTRSWCSTLGTQTSITSMSGRAISFFQSSSIDS